MQVPQNNSRVARFGVFELDLSAGELRKSGVKLRLQGQPFQVLALLLERAGEVVTREELQQKLWPSDTFVDFDHSLNTAINKVREALGDSASSPRYVETLARRGYRFIAPVEWLTSVGDRHGLHNVVPIVPPRPTAVPQPTTAKRKWKLILLASLVILAALAVSTFVLWRHQAQRAQVAEQQLTANSSENSVSSTAISPDGKQLVFVSTRGSGYADIWTLEIATRRAKALSSGPGGDYRPAWSPDGKWIAFSSGRGITAPFAEGRWERQQLAEIYLIRPDGSGMKKVTNTGGFCGSPKWMSDSPSRPDSDDEIARDAMKISRLTHVDPGRTGVSTFMA